MFPAAKAVANEALNMCDTLTAGAGVTVTFVIATAIVR